MKEHKRGEPLFDVGAIEKPEGWSDVDYADLVHGLGTVNGFATYVFNPGRIEGHALMAYGMYMLLQTQKWDRPRLQQAFDELFPTSESFADQLTNAMELRKAMLMKPGEKGLD